MSIEGKEVFYARIYGRLEEVLTSIFIVVFFCTTIYLCIDKVLWSMLSPSTKNSISCQKQLRWHIYIKGDHHIEALPWLYRPLFVPYPSTPCGYRLSFERPRFMTWLNVDLSLRLPTWISKWLFQAIKSQKNLTVLIPEKRTLNHRI